MATRIVAPGGAPTHPQSAGHAQRGLNITASALHRGKVCLMQFAARLEIPATVTVLSPAGAEALAQQLLAPVAIARTVVEVTHA
nr:hypothetical protein [Variovorax boronicumulans]